VISEGFRRKDWGAEFFDAPCVREESDLPAGNSEPAPQELAGIFRQLYMSACTVNYERRTLVSPTFIRYGQAGV
jgi:hypothetical protein